MRVLHQGLAGLVQPVLGFGDCGFVFSTLITVEEAMRMPFTLINDGLLDPNQPLNPTPARKPEISPGKPSPHASLASKSREQKDDVTWGNSSGFRVSALTLGQAWARVQGLGILRGSYKLCFFFEESAKVVASFLTLGDVGHLEGIKAEALTVSGFLKLYCIRLADLG